MGVDHGGPHFLFRKTFPQRAGRIGVIENMPTRFEFHLVFRNRQRPSAERVHQSALEIKVTQQPPAIFFDRKLTAELATIHREMIGVAGAPLRRGFALARHALGSNDSLIDRSIFFRG